jgi:hypothetical protein
MMRELNECKAEIFWRSEKRIKARRKRRRCILGVCVPLCLVIVLWQMPMPLIGGEKSSDSKNYMVVGSEENYNGTTDNVPFGRLDSFSFSLTWGCYGISSYDSRTGKLVKTTDATHPEDYVTEYFLTDAERQEIRDILTELDIENLGEFDYDDFGLSNPHLKLSLTVKMGDVDKTVNIPEAAIGYDSGRTPKAKKLLSAIQAIRDILVNTDEWKALPDYEFYYD